MAQDGGAGPNRESSSARPPSRDGAPRGNGSAGGEELGWVPGRLRIRVVVTEWTGSGMNAWSLHAIAWYKHAYESAHRPPLLTDPGRGLPAPLRARIDPPAPSRDRPPRGTQRGLGAPGDEEPLGDRPGLAAKGRQPHLLRRQPRASSFPGNPRPRPQNLRTGGGPPRGPGGGRHPRRFHLRLDGGRGSAPRQRHRSHGDRRRDAPGDLDEARGRHRDAGARDQSACFPRKGICLPSPLRRSFRLFRIGLTQALRDRGRP